MSRRPFESIQSIENVFQQTPSRSSTRPTTLSRNISTFVRNYEKVCMLTRSILSKIQTIRFQIDQDNTTEAIQNRRTGSLRERRAERERFWYLPEINLYRYRDWGQILNGWNMFCSQVFDENTPPNEFRIWQEFIKDMLKKLKKMDKKCKEWNRYSFR